jgi:glycosyltransferase involved in cell wall biosynthesis
MANSKIVIGTVGNGFDQLINDGENGFVIPVDDSLALLKTIIHVLNLSAAEKTIIELAAKQRTDLLHPDIVLNQVVDLYKQTIANFKN